MPRTLVIAGTHSGVGKTTVTCGLASAFSCRGLSVQTFKCGPDFLDPLQHQEALGGKGESVNLCGFLQSEDTLRKTFFSHARGADIVLIEGVMGLFDSKDGLSEEGSTAEVAKKLQAPVVLVIDAWAMSRSAAAMLLGFRLFDPDLRVGAVVCNRVAGASHAAWIEAAIGKEEKLRECLFAGALPKDARVERPERHLGLVPPAEGRGMPGSLGALTSLVESCLDLEGLLRLAGECRAEAPSCEPVGGILPVAPKCRVAAVRDAAFCFYYTENLRMLREVGAEILFCSALEDSQLPDETDAVIILGGFPEMYAERLEANGSFRQSVERFVEEGGPVLAECGGLMFLCSVLSVPGVTGEGQRGTKGGKEGGRDERGRARLLREFQMCGVFSDLEVEMTPQANLALMSVETSEGNPLFPPGLTCKAHVFHFSRTKQNRDKTKGGSIEREGRSSRQDSKSSGSPFLFHAQGFGGSGRTEGMGEPSGVAYKRCVASFAHMHWADSPAFPRAFVEAACAQKRRRSVRAVSFVATATEIVFALDAEASLVGVSSLCDFPEEAKNPPREVVVRSGIDAENMSSEEVEEAMQKVKRGEMALWEVDMERIRRLRPSDACDTCDPALVAVMTALKPEGLQEDTATAVSPPQWSPRMVSVAPRSLTEVFSTVEKVGVALACEDRATRLVQQWKNSLDELEGFLPSAVQERGGPRVLSLEGLTPPCCGGLWLPDVKRRAGCVDALGMEGGGAPRRLTWREVGDSDPDILALCPCSSDPSKTLRDLQQILFHNIDAASVLWSLRAVQSGRVFILDHALFSRPGPRLIQGVQLLAACAHVTVREELERRGLASADVLGPARVLKLSTDSFEFPFSADTAAEGLEVASLFKPLLSPSLALESRSACVIPQDIEEVGSGSCSQEPLEETAEILEDRNGRGGFVQKSPKRLAAAVSEEAPLDCGNQGGPVTVADLSEEERAAAQVSRRPHAMAHALHRKAVALGRQGYEDPGTGECAVEASAAAVDGGDVSLWGSPQTHHLGNAGTGTGAQKHRHHRIITISKAASNTKHQMRLVHDELKRQTRFTTATVDALVFQEVSEAMERSARAARLSLEAKANELASLFVARVRDDQMVRSLVGLLVAWWLESLQRYASMDPTLLKIMGSPLARKGIGGTHGAPVTLDLAPRDIPSVTGDAGGETDQFTELLQSLQMQQQRGRGLGSQAAAALGDFPPHLLRLTAIERLLPQAPQVNSLSVTTLGEAAGPSLSASSTISKQGWLRKRGASTREWYRRFCKVHPLTRLFSFYSSEDTASVSTWRQRNDPFSHMNASAEGEDGGKKGEADERTEGARGFELVQQEENRAAGHFYFLCDSPSEASEWVEEIRKLSGAKYSPSSLQPKQQNGGGTSAGQLLSLSGIRRDSDGTGGKPSIPSLHLRAHGGVSSPASGQEARGEVSRLAGAVRTSEVEWSPDNRIRQAAAAAVAAKDIDRLTYAPLLAKVGEVDPSAAGFSPIASSAENHLSAPRQQERRGTYGGAFSRLSIPSTLMESAGASSNAAPGSLQKLGQAHREAVEDEDKNPSFNEVTEARPRMVRRLSETSQQNGGRGRTREGEGSPTWSEVSQARPRVLGLLSEGESRRAQGGGKDQEEDGSPGWHEVTQARPRIVGSLSEARNGERGGHAGAVSPTHIADTSPLPVPPSGGAPTLSPSVSDDVAPTPSAGRTTDRAAPSGNFNDRFRTADGGGMHYAEAPPCPSRPTADSGPSPSEPSASSRGPPTDAQSTRRGLDEVIGDLSRRAMETGTAQENAKETGGFFDFHESNFAVGLSQLTADMSDIRRECIQLKQQEDFLVKCRDPRKLHAFSEYQQAIRRASDLRDSSRASLYEFSFLAAHLRERYLRRTTAGGPRTDSDLPTAFQDLLQEAAEREEHTLLSPESTSQAAIAEKVQACMEERITIRDPAEAFEPPIIHPHTLTATMQLGPDGLPSQQQGETAGSSQKTVQLFQGIVMKDGEESVDSDDCRYDFEMQELVDDFLADPLNLSLQAAALAKATRLGYEAPLNDEERALASRMAVRMKESGDSAMEFLHSLDRRRNILVHDVDNDQMLRDEAVSTNPALREHLKGQGLLLNRVQKKGDTRSRFRQTQKFPKPLDAREKPEKWDLSMLPETSDEPRPLIYFGDFLHKFAKAINKHSAVANASTTGKGRKGRRAMAQAKLREELSKVFDRLAAVERITRAVDSSLHARKQGVPWEHPWLLEHLTYPFGPASLDPAALALVPPEDKEEGEEGEEEKEGGEEDATARPKSPCSRSSMWASKEKHEFRSAAPALQAAVLLQRPRKEKDNDPALPNSVHGGIGGFDLASGLYQGHTLSPRHLRPSRPGALLSNVDAQTEFAHSWVDGVPSVSPSPGGVALGEGVQQANLNLQPVNPSELFSQRVQAPRRRLDSWTMC
uniref:Cobyrinic acid a,c-diamide synthase n=1 Tax=Chromera velia CCMP2878 TaxID=1169474 RepID=A0A0K6S809_9ALVE|eukprot:Cvel_5019.t1-p1 / transcript=Cvel_5019.t1 / gene=Cvel_5019 / organism=Chromera_velia_CCMP2878 / gene_product=Cobyrinic acid A,C-diamide synthase, putative / transcript_product=Cobyrinic acid A,C-diamide synthase, putative / location=Cvel_scaffold228:19742-38598(-) / protein_length=2426 / sequence_SO=supercontig / SO=protein_coding / is_pseudo=false